MKTKTAISVLIIHIFLFTSYTGISQTHKVVKGPTHRMSMKEGGWSDIDPIGNDASGTYFLLYSFAKVYGGAYIGSKDSYIGKVAADKSLEAFEVLDLRYEDKELELEFGLELQNTTYIFSSFENNELKKSFLFAQTLNRNTLKLNEDMVKVAEIDYSKENKYKNMYYSYRLSPDKSKVLFVHNLVDKDGTLLDFRYTVTDARLQKLGQVAGIEMPGDGIYNFQDYQISGSGHVYLLTKYFDEKKAYNQNAHLEKQGILSNTRTLTLEANFSYKILEFTKFNRVPKEVTVSLGSDLVTSVTFFPKDEGGLMCMGFYSANEDAIPDGVFTQNMDKSLKVLATEKKHLEGQFDQPSKYVKNTYKASGLLKKRDDLTNFRFVLKDIVKKKSGGYLLAAERTSTLTKTTGNQQTGWTTVTIYHTDDIAVVDASPQGKINWISKVEKSQETASLSTLYSSFGVEEYEDDILLFFTDFSAQNLKTFGKVIDTESCMVRINSEGQATKEVLFTADEEKITMKGRKTYEAREGSYLLYGHNGMLIVGFVGVDM